MSGIINGIGVSKIGFMKTPCGHIEICSYVDRDNRHAFFTLEQSVEIALAILAEADPALAAKVKAVDALIEATKNILSDLCSAEPWFYDAVFETIKQLETALRSAGVEAKK